MPKKTPQSVKFNGTPIKETAFSNGWSLEKWDGNTYTFSIKKGTYVFGIYLTTLTVRVVDKSRKWGDDQIFIKGLSLPDVLDLITAPESVELAFQDMQKFRTKWNLN